MFTRDMLWDLETRKARHPDVFIPYVLATGSAAAWGDGRYLRPQVDGIAGPLSVVTNALPECLVFGPERLALRANRGSAFVDSVSSMKPDVWVDPSGERINTGVITALLTISLIAIVLVGCILDFSYFLGVWDLLQTWCSGHPEPGVPDQPLIPSCQPTPGGDQLELYFVFGGHLIGIMLGFVALIRQCFHRHGLTWSIVGWVAFLGSLGFSYCYALRLYR
ncbi:hypothetical protein [Fodinicola feengrottensis]|uniref:hypothetical protein n=1 Tax=Fodinicola feengrottensis TaxID=435914 RepID=UPI0031DC078E